MENVIDEKVTGNKGSSNSKLLIVFLLILPFCFIILRSIESHAIKLGIPSAVVFGLFTAVVYISVKKNDYKLLLGVFLITPLFLSACCAFADYSFFSAGIGAKFQRQMLPSMDNLLGTDYEQRDILSTIVIGGMHAYIIAVIATGIALLIGVPIGLLLASNADIHDGKGLFYAFKVILLKGLKLFGMAVTQLFEIVPQLFFVIIVIGVYNLWASDKPDTRMVTQYSVPLAALAIGLSSLPSISRLVENKVSQLKKERFVVTLRSSNVNSTKIMFYNILWNNCFAEIMIQASFIFGATILIETGLGYAFEVGFGEIGTGNYLSWGQILAESRKSILFGESVWIIASPIIVTIMSILGINILGDCLAKYLRNDRGHND
jgi:peptide/nickel transport system permease protein